MREFAETAFGFPTIVFSLLLMVVIGYWLLAIAGIDALETEADVLGVIGLRGIPASIIVSLFATVSWFLCLAGSVWLDGRPLVALPALAGGWLVTRLAVNPLRYVLPESKVHTRNDFVGRMCVIRTGRVTAGFGQAEVHSEDGSSALVQVRQHGDEPLRSGSAALIFDYDAAGEFFWVMPYDAALDPNKKGL